MSGQAGLFLQISLGFVDPPILGQLLAAPVEELGNEDSTFGPDRVDELDGNRNGPSTMLVRPRSTSRGNLRNFTVKFLMAFATKDDQILEVFNTLDAHRSGDARSIPWSRCRAGNENELVSVFLAQSFPLRSLQILLVRHCLKWAQ